MDFKLAMLGVAVFVVLALMAAPAAVTAMVVVTPPEGGGGCTQEMTVDLIAGQHIDAGNVIVSVCNNNLNITYVTEDEWLLGELHLAVASSLDGIPQTKKGNPIPGKFNFTAHLEDYKTTYTFEIPLDGLSGTILIAAQAEVYKQADGGLLEETAWGEGVQFPGSNWAMYFSYNLP